MYKMLALAALAVSLLGCGPSFESACKGFCDKVADCGDVPATAEELAECKSDCEEAEIEGQQEIEAGTLTQACYDATAELFDCATKVDCSDLNSQEAPARCRGDAVRFQNACEDT